MKMTSGCWIVLAGLSAGLAGCATEPKKPEHAPPPVSQKLEPYSCGSIQRLHTHKSVFLASQPQPADFKQAKEGGVKTVVNLRKPGEIQDFDEAKVVGDLGLAYHNPGFGGAADMSDAKLDEARGLLRTQPRPILLHCASANRVGAVWLAYRTLDEGLAYEQALEEAKTVGLKSPDMEAKVKDYIQRQKK